MKARKILANVMALVLVAALSVVGTVAYLNDRSGKIKNTFTVGNIEIKLEETKIDTDNLTVTSDKIEEGENKYKVYPEQTIDYKDPTVTVIKDSEKCYLFIKVDETDAKNIITWTIADGWTALTGETGVYYRVVESSTSDQAFTVLKDNSVMISKDLGSTTMTADDLADVSLEFSAYAIQFAGFADAAAAWAGFSN